MMGLNCLEMEEKMRKRKRNSLILICLLILTSCKSNAPTENNTISPLQSGPFPPSPPGLVMINRQSSFVSQPPPTNNLPIITNITTLGFYSGLDYSPLHFVTIQSTSSSYPSDTFTNTPYKFSMGDSNIMIALETTNDYRYYRLSWDSGFFIPPGSLITLTNR